MVLAFVAAFLIAALLTTALLGDDRSDRQERRDQRRQDRAERTEPPAPEITDLPSALANLESTVAEAVAGETMTSSLGDAVLGEAAKSVQEYEKGSLDKALEHLEHADDRVEDDLTEAQVTPESAETTRQAIALVASAMQSAPPEVQTDDGDEDGDGPGNSEEGPGNSGEAPGHNKDDDDDD
jgi:hypothetical protein